MLRQASLRQDREVFAELVEHRLHATVKERDHRGGMVNEDFNPGCVCMIPLKTSRATAAVLFYGQPNTCQIRYFDSCSVA